MHLHAIPPIFVLPSTGHYLPAIAHAIHRSNKEGKHLHLNLKGVLLGNPIIDAFHLYKYSPKYAVKNKLISKVNAQLLLTHNSKCEKSSHFLQEHFFGFFNTDETSLLWVQLNCSLHSFRFV